MDEDKKKEEKKMRRLTSYPSFPTSCSQVFHVLTGLLAHGGLVWGVPGPSGQHHDRLDPGGPDVASHPFRKEPAESTRPSPHLPVGGQHGHGLSRSLRLDFATKELRSLINLLRLSQD